MFIHEDSARIIERAATLRVEGGLGSLIENMLEEKRIRPLPTPDDPAFTLADPERREALAAAHRAIEPMFWGPRLSLDDAARTIREWLSKLGRTEV